MAGAIKMYVPTGLQCFEEEELMEDIIKDVRAMTATPKRMSVHGAYGSWIVFKFNKNAVRDALITVMTNRGLSFDIR